MENSIDQKADDSKDFRDEKKENLYRRISFWLSIILTTLIVIWYVVKNPPESEQVQRMRMFFKENGMEVGKFIKLPRDEQKAFADSQKHPFYQQYLNSSEVEKNKIRALIHISYDYTPYQYWFNIFFLWVIFFTMFWFIGLMIEGGIILVRKDQAKRRASRRIAK